MILHQNRGIQHPISTLKEKEEVNLSLFKQVRNNAKITPAQKALRTFHYNTILSKITDAFAKCMQAHI